MWQFLHDVSSCHFLPFVSWQDSPLATTCYHLPLLEMSIANVLSHISHSFSAYYLHFTCAQIISALSSIHNGWSKPITFLSGIPPCSVWLDQTHNLCSVSQARILILWQKILWKSVKQVRICQSVSQARILILWQKNDRHCTSPLLSLYNPILHIHSKFKQIF